MLTVRDAARRTGRNAETVRRWIWDGKLPARKIGNQLFVEEEDLAQLTSGARDRRLVEQAALVAELREFHRALRERGRVPVGDAAELIERTRADEALARQPDQDG